jgi:hypothetical protein
MQCDRKGVEARNIVALARQKNEANNIAKRVNERRNFGAREPRELPIACF